MKLDFRKAINAPFSDKEWYIKLIFPCVVTGLVGIILCSKSYILKVSANIPNFLFFGFLIFCLIIGFVASGFFVQFRHNSICDFKHIIPETKGHIDGYLVQGFNSAIINFVYLMLNKLIDIIGHIPIREGAGLLSVLVLSCMYIILSISGAFSQNIYADSFYFHKAFDYKRIFCLMSKVKKEIFIFYCFCFVVILLCGMIALPCVMLCRHIHMNYMLFLILWYPLCVIVGTLILLIFYNLQAQIYVIAKNRVS